MIKILCDGCEVQIPLGETAVRGEHRAKIGTRHYMPETTFHWCTDCATVARAAVKEKEKK